MLVGLGLLVAAFSIKGTVSGGGGVVVAVLAVVGLAVFFGSYSTGYGPTTWVVLSELFPVAERGRAMAVAVAVNWASNLVVSLTFLSLVDAIGEVQALHHAELVCFPSHESRWFSFPLV